jgi:hypothetical protein
VQEVKNLKQVMENHFEHCVSSCDAPAENSLKAEKSSRYPFSSRDGALQFFEAAKKDPALFDEVNEL